MKQKTMMLLFLGLVLAGCAALSDMNKMEGFNEAANSYRLAIRWSDFDVAENFIRKPPTHGIGDVSPNRESLQDVRVISYEVRDVVISPELSKVSQVVDIHYYRLNRMIEKTVRVNESWEYDPDAKRWYLKEGFPPFQ